MTFSQLRTFIAVVQAGSITVAANKLFVSQAAVSSVLIGLKQELGVELVVRDGRGIRVTSSGQVLYKYSQLLLGLLEETRTATMAEADPRRSLLRIAAVTTAGESLLPMWLRSFLKLNPDLEVKLEVGNRARVFELLEQHNVDLAIAGRPPAGRGFTTLATRRHNLVLVASAHSDLADLHHDGAIDYAVLARRTWLVREDGSGTRVSVDELLEHLAISPRVLTLGSNVAVREAAALDVGLALLSSDSVIPQLENGTLIQLDVPPLPVVKYWHIVTRTSEMIPDVALNFSKHLLETGQANPPEDLRHLRSGPSSK